VGETYSTYRRFSVRSYQCNEGNEEERDNLRNGIFNSFGVKEGPLSGYWSSGGFNYRSFYF
jgi:hypothetical protein